MLIKLLALIVLVFITNSCYKQPTSDKKKTRFEFIGANFRYEATEERKSQIMGNYSKVELGMSKAEIESILGEPDYSELTPPSVVFGEPPNGSVWKYALYCTSQFCGTTSEDKIISVFFNLDDKADWIAPSGIKELSPKGEPYKGYYSR